MNEEQTPCASPQNILQDSLLSEKRRGKTAVGNVTIWLPKGEISKYVFLLHLIYY